MQKIKPIILSTLIISLLLSLVYTAEADEKYSKNVSIGVLARRGAVECLKEWSPTAQYLTERLPGFKFEIVPLDFREISPAVSSKQVDFVIVNPYVYVELQELYGASRMVTLKRLTPKGNTALFGGSIFCKADRGDITSIKDLKGHSFAAVDETSFGGWMVAWRELKTVGIDPQKNLTRLFFSGTHDDVVMAVRDGKVDAGTVATPILAQMIAEGKISQNTFKILNSTKTADSAFGLSTRLYSEWPFAKLKETSDDIAEQVAIALLAMPRQSSAAISAEIAGWTVPFDYTEVQTCMKELQVGIYKEYGKITLTKMFTVYRWQIFSIIAAVFILAGMLLRSRSLNQKLLITEKNLLLEMQKRRRSNEELAQANIFLEQSQQQLAHVIDFLPDATFVIDKEKKVTIWNKAMEEMTGVSKEEMVGQGDYAYTVPFYGEKRKTLIDFLDFEDDVLMNSYKHIGKTGSTLFAEAFAPTLYDGKGATIWATCSPLFDSDGDYAGTIESIRDITKQRSIEQERQKLEQRVMQLQKAESLGRMAGAIAHHFNNQLGVVIGNIEMAIDDLSENSETGKILAAAMQASHKAAEISSLMLTYLGQKYGKHVPLDLSETCRQNLSLLQATVPKNITFNIDLPVPGPIISGDVNQIELVLTNLVTNAWEAMWNNQVSIGLTVKSASSLDISAVHFFPIDWQSQNTLYACLEVTDEGSGIADTDIKTLFDPFFSSKFVGRGLGLSIVLGIVKGHNGVITVHSEMGIGSTFRVFFPLSDEKISQVTEQS